MSAPNPQVSVFHFNARISTAKIRKYKLATERGMVQASNSNARVPTPSTNGAQRPTPSPSVEPATMEPLAKKPKLRLNVRAPTDSPDTIAVSRPRRESSLKIRYSENMVVDPEDQEPVSEQAKVRPSPAASSELSSLASIPPIEKEATPAQEPPSKSDKPRDYGRDFMSYYVTGGDEDEEDAAEDAPPPKPAPPTSQPRAQPQPQPQPPSIIEAPPLRPLQAPQPPQAVPAPKPRETKFRHHTIPSYPAPKIQPPKPPLLQPTVHLIDDTKKPRSSQEPENVATMVKKIEYLSDCLTTFGGVPSAPQSPQQKKGKPPKPAPAATKDAPVDTLLAIFDDEDSDDSKDDLDFTIRSLGDADGPLTFGIQFIQNALKSWAQNQLNREYTQHVMRYEQHTRELTQPPKRGPGRPRKFDNDGQRLTPPPAPEIQVNLTSTKEGRAVAAFQDVLDSGCLQVNAVLPVALTRALRHLYMQIDHLINQGSRNEPQWQCMSYGAQIAAHKSRVDEWNQAEAKHKEEMARQQHLAQQQILQQMGIPLQQHHQPNRHTMSAEQAQHQHAIDLERRRGLQYAAQQPHLTQSLTNPLSLNSQQTTAPKATAPSPSPVNGPTASSPTAIPAIVSNDKSDVPPSKLSGGLDKGYMDKVTLYSSDVSLPLSGQKMKFSFAPQNPAALKAFGPQAFPSSHIGPSLPNRGPMSASPVVPSMPVNISPSTIRNNVPTPVLGSHGLNLQTTGLKRSFSEMTNVGKTGPSPRASQKPVAQPEAKPASQPQHTNGTNTAKDSANHFSSFTAVNTTAKDFRPKSSTANLPTPMSPLKQTIDTPNGKPASLPLSPAQESRSAELASRYPHPGAVVVDE